MIGVKGGSKAEDVGLTAIVGIDVNVAAEVGGEIGEHAGRVAPQRRTRRSNFKKPATMRVIVTRESPLLQVDSSL